MHNIMNCEVMWPRINRPYKWKDNAYQDATGNWKGRTMPADDPSDPAAHYELNLILKEDQTKAMLDAMRADWKEGIKSGRISEKQKAIDPKTLAKIKKLEDGRYEVTCKNKNYDAKSKPMQFGPDKKPLPDDFELTSNSKIHIAVKFYFYKNGEGVHIQPKKLRVVELAERMSHDDFDDGFGEAEENADPFDLPEISQTKAAPSAADSFDDEIPF